MTSPKERFKILGADITYISLCPRGKNLISTLYKEDDGSLEFQTLVKDDKLEEEGELTSIVYAVGMPDADGHLVDDKGVIKQMMKSFMRNGSKIDIRHNQKALSKEDIYLTECFQTKASDPEFAGMKDKLGREINMDGAWVTRYQVDSAQLRKEYREGKWDGVSLFGQAVLAPVSKETSTENFLDALAVRLRAGTQETQEEIDMKPEELKKALDEQAVAITKGLTDALTDILKPKEEKTTKVEKQEPPAFEGDKTDPVAVQKHIQKMRVFNLQKEVDWNDPASIEAYHAKIAKSQDGDGDDKPEDKNSATATQIAKLRKEIEKLQGRSTQSGDTPSTELSKEQKEVYDHCDRAAAYINGESVKR